MELIVSFIILHYKDIKSTDACVRSILQMDGRDYIRIVIVDNDIRATEEERRKLAERYKKYSAIDVVSVREKRRFFLWKQSRVSFCQGETESFFYYCNK